MKDWDGEVGRALKLFVQMEVGYGINILNNG
jgi:hypothetical protein